MYLKSEKLEFRGLTSRKNKDGVTVFNVALESEDTEQLNFYLGTEVEHFVGIKKGEYVSLDFDYDIKWNRLKVVGVTKND